MDEARLPTHVELFALQPRVALEDYASPSTFAARHRALAERVDRLRTRDEAGRPRHPALAVWPEWVGAPLELLGHVQRVQRHTTVRSALRRVARAEWWDVWRTWKELHPPTMVECLHATLASRVHRVMHETFSAIARDFGLWVVAGSAFLPDNRLTKDGPDFEPRGARIFNTSHTFSPEGVRVATARKVNVLPASEDRLRLSPGRPEDLTLIDTPFGRLGTLLGYDGAARPRTSKEPWFVPCAQYLDTWRAQVVAHPSAHPGDWDERSLDEGLLGQLPALRHVRYTVTAQLAGELFDQRFEAPSLIVERTSGGTTRVLARAEPSRADEVLHALVPVCAA